MPKINKSSTESKQKCTKPLYKRKEKSLEELSQKFLKALANEKEGVVRLDELTARFGEFI